MWYMVLTQSSTFLIGDIAKLLGIIMDTLFEFTTKFGVTNIGLSIILFTLIVKLLMFPLTIKQQKFSKISTIMQPELQAIQKKYKGKSDQESMLRMNEETKAVYAKYGTSPTGGCLQLFIQLPILYALFRVINNIPAYVVSVKEVFLNIVTPLMQQEGYLEVLSGFASNHAMTSSVYDFTQSNYVIDLLYKFTSSEWIQLEEAFPALAEIIAENSAKITQMNTFLGLDLASAPGFALTPALLIPLFAGLSQWLSAKMMQSNQPENTNQNDEENPMMQSMKMMTTTMPLISAFFCVSMPCALGIYWISTSVFQIIQQAGINYYFNHTDMEKVIEKNVEKANKKRAKKGLPPQKLSNAATISAKNLNKTHDKLARAEELKKKQQELEERYQKMQESTEYYNKGLAKPGSLSAKANMVQQFNEKNEKKKK